MRLFRATIFDVSRIERCATMCCAEHGEEVTGGPFNWDHYRDTWLDILTKGMGAMFLVEDEDGKIVGGIAGAIYPAMLTGLPRVNQLFIYVMPAYRGKISMRKLVTELEVWAVEHGAQDFLMPCLESMPEKTQSFYEHMGFKSMEVLYRKTLKPVERSIS